MERFFHCCGLMPQEFSLSKTNSPRKGYVTHVVWMVFIWSLILYVTQTRTWASGHQLEASSSFPWQKSPVPLNEGGHIYVGV